ncbi:expressed protein [Chlorella variabilis]|uniref:Expressed protein n=1 Tax=Chlorella variabilis TaxID=554065 RepID=E1ZIL4_CHLVA|nr:expressed protein [Chlorella variabilis]EFN54354.1 expressed protein [Chlorella variabilis]|eukprot:XP_005846456.1 expressed protein [Chlorella variabilis]
MPPAPPVQLEAIESAETAGASATQLMLETDPAARGPRAQYEVHYAELALIQLQGALDMHAHLRQSLGVEEADRLLKQEKLALAAAECQLLRDRTQQTIASVQQRQEDNIVACED